MQSVCKIYNIICVHVSESLYFLLKAFTFLSYDTGATTATTITTITGSNNDNTDAIREMIMPLS